MRGLKQVDCQVECRLHQQKLEQNSVLWFGFCNMAFSVEYNGTIYFSTGNLSKETVLLQMFTVGMISGRHLKSKGKA